MAPPAPQSQTAPTAAAPPADAPEPQWNGTTPFIHYSAIGFAIISPLTMLLPGRRKGGIHRLQSMILAGSAFWGFNQLAYDYTGKSIYQRSNERWAKVLTPMELPEKAKQNRALMEAERARRAAAGSPEEQVAAESRLRRREDADLNAIDRLMGAEKGWKEKRDEREREALASGKGYWDLITEQIWDVVNQTGGKKEGGSDDTKNGAEGASGKKP
ncbi:hypothetical protein GQ53DRAFT_753366 [Thozetella sp. PMI_491]|nr:hypothetical protein GQ53DRAFT_753366 [Thozetella sp. PMI_491]